MRTKLLLVISLSVLSVSCASDEFADRPPGWNCTYFFDAKNSPKPIIEKLKAAQTIEEVQSLTAALKQLKPDTSGFYCNGLRNPENSKQFNVADPSINKARCMPLETAEAYDEYLRKKYKELKQRCQ